MGPFSDVQLLSGHSLLRLYLSCYCHRNVFQDWTPFAGFKLSNNLSVWVLPKVQIIDPLKDFYVAQNLLIKVTSQKFQTI